MAAKAKAPPAAVAGWWGLAAPRQAGSEMAAEASEAVANAAGKVLSHASAEQVCWFSVSLFSCVCLFVQTRSIAMNCFVFHRKQIRIFIKIFHIRLDPSTYHISLSQHSLMRLLCISLGLHPFISPPDGRARRRFARRARRRRLCE